MFVKGRAVDVGRTFLWSFNLVFAVSSGFWFLIGRVLNLCSVFKQRWLCIRDVICCKYFAEYIDTGLVHSFGLVLLQCLSHYTVSFKGVITFMPPLMSAAHLNFPFCSSILSWRLRRLGPLKALTFWLLPAFYTTCNFLLSITLAEECIAIVYNSWKTVKYI